MKHYPTLPDTVLTHPRNLNITNNYNIIIIKLHRLARCCNYVVALESFQCISHNACR